MDCDFKANIIAILELEYGKTVNEATTVELYNAISRAARNRLFKDWGCEAPGKTVCYLSAEFLVGNFIYSNLYNMGLFQPFADFMAENHLDIGMFEDIEDAALGNGGLGRLAACFLDSAATIGITLHGYGIRYKYGLFRQSFANGFQMEEADNWQRFGDPWSVRREEEKLRIEFKGQSVYAVPYDTPIIGYEGKKVNTLRLWQAEPVDEFDFALFNNQQYEKAVKNRNEAEMITSVLYPNDSTNTGKRLRIKQEYFFSSAAMQDIIRKYKKKNGNDFSHFPEEYKVQLNDTHPVFAIPEFIRLLVEQEGVHFLQAILLAKETFAFTNHTVMEEALEKWSVPLLKSVIPKVYQYIVKINNLLVKELKEFNKQTVEEQIKYLIIDHNLVHMARLAIFICYSTNGVAKLHTEIIKKDTMKEWYEIYPERFNNKTNGITQRRWLALANRELTEFITDKIGSSWITDLNRLKELSMYIEDKDVIQQFSDIKQKKKHQLCDYILRKDGIRINPDTIFDVQVKRLHEYKRQLLNAFSIMDLYFGLKDGRIKDFYPTTFLFGAKAAPGYARAKGIIKYINEISRLLKEDPEVRDKLQVVFISNYNVSYAEKIIPATNISVQISTAGMEASGTGNMKFMLNGAVTLGTYDGANIEIVEEAGEGNNYIFGARVEDIERERKTYEPKVFYEANPRVKRVVDTLIDNTVQDEGTGMFKELYDSLLVGASWHIADNYYLLPDLIALTEARLRANRDYKDILGFGKKCMINTCNAGKFSSDRTIQEYWKEIWLK